MTAKKKLKWSDKQKIVFPTTTMKSSKTKAQENPDFFASDTSVAFTNNQVVGSGRFVSYPDGPEIVNSKF